jgi:hypothetical protein
MGTWQSGWKLFVIDDDGQDDLLLGAACFFFAIV